MLYFDDQCYDEIIDHPNIIFFKFNRKKFDQTPDVYINLFKSKENNAIYQNIFNMIENENIN